LVVSVSKVLSLQIIGTSINITFQKYDITVVIKRHCVQICIYMMYELFCLHRVVFKMCNMFGF